MNNIDLNYEKINELASKQFTASKQLEEYSKNVKGGPININDFGDGKQDLKKKKHQQTQTTGNYLKHTN